MFDVNLTTEIIDNATENKPTALGLNFNGTALEVPKNNVVSGFVNSIRALLKASVSGATERHVSYWTTRTVKGELVDFIEIPNNSKTTDIFNIFKKHGMYVTKFLCGYCESTKTIHVSAKTARDMSRMSNETNAAIVMYIISLMNFVKNASGTLADITHDVYSDMVNAVVDSKTWENLFTSFDKETTYKVCPSGTDDLIGIRYVRNELTSRDMMTPAPGMKFSYLYDANKSEYVGALIPVVTGITTFNYVVLPTKVVTDFDLCTVELRNDSMCSAIASGFAGTVNVVKANDFKDIFKDNIELRLCDIEEIPEDLPKWLSTWTKAMIAKGATTATNADVKALSESYAIKIPKGYTGCDPEELKSQYAKDDYAQELFKQVKPYYDTFDLGNLNANIAGFAKGTIYAMAFVGESGTGKSTAARVLPYKCGLPYVSINFSVNIEEADLFGSMFPNAFKKSAEDPEFVWQDGIITKAVRNGYVVILEEINFARPGVLGKLNSLLDENRQLDLPNGEVLRAHPNFRIIATCNIAYEGTNRFNKALINRFDDVTVFKDLKRDEAIEVIKSRTGYTDKAKIDKVYNVYEALKKFAHEQGINVVVSMRQLLNLFTKGKYYKDARDAVVRIMLNGAFLEDAEYQKVFEDTVLPAFDLKFKI